MGRSQMIHRGHVETATSTPQFHLQAPFHRPGFPGLIGRIGVVSYLGKAMQRRDFIRLSISSGIALPIAARAQQFGGMRRLGFLSSYTEEAGEGLVECFRKGLEDAGWVEGRNILIQYRWAGGRRERYSALAVELVGLKLDVIACNSTPAAQALQQATADIPIVFMTVSAPVQSGIVNSFAHPEGNITGVSNYSPATVGKLLEFLKTVRPDISRIMVLRDPANRGKLIDVRELRVNATKLGLTLQIIDVRNGDDIERAFSAVGKRGGIGLIALTDGVTLSHRRQIAYLANRTRLPTMFQTKEFVRAGGLMSYGVNFCQHFRRAAVYVDRILKGAKPAELPVELPTTFELVVNLRVAKTIGITIPPNMLALADQVIE
jgi:putative ABC transport system substrate-binding protein